MSINEYEAARAKRIEENRARMAQLGITQVVEDIKASVAANRAQSRQQRAARKAALASARAADGRPRRSTRVEGLPVPNYNENAMLLALADGNVADKRDRRLLTENTSLEEYGLAHLEALGDHSEPWELFVDGYDAAGNRIYDKVNGQTCHQCRQKTLGKRTACACCTSLQGVFCGDCLFMRYGENILEATANPAWTCPVCRDLCNCSFHRSKRGWAPTGTLYRRATAEGFKSVAHYLVLHSLTAEAKAVAVQRKLAPPELHAQLQRELKSSQQQQEAGAAAEPAAEAEACGKDEQEAAAAPAVQEHLLAPAAAPELAADTAPAAALGANSRKRKATSMPAAVKMLKAAAKKATPPAVAAASRRGLRSSSRLVQQHA